MKSLLTKRWVHILLLLGLLAAAIVLRIQDPQMTKSMRYMAFDTFNNIYPRPPTNEVVIVDIDEDSLKDINQGQWPWSRTVIADLVSNLKEMGAKVVVFDMVFSEKDKTSPSALLRNLPEGLITEEEALKIASLPDHDEVFAQAIKKAGNVVTGYTMTNVRPVRPTVTPPHINKSAKGLFKTFPLTIGTVPSLQMLEKAAAGNGYFGIGPASHDGIIREPPLFTRVIGDNIVLYPTLSVEALRLYLAEGRLVKLLPGGNKESASFYDDFLSPEYLLKIGETEVPLNENGLFYVHFSKVRADKYINAWTVLNKSINPARVKDKIVLIGTSAVGLKDLRSTPINPNIAGVEIHLNIIEQILQKRFLQRLPIIQGGEIILTFLMGLMIIMFSPFISPILMALITLGMIGGMGAGSFILFKEQGYLIDPLYPSAAIFLISVMATLLTYVRTEAERRAVRQAFGLYISPDYMKELANNPDQLRLGGELRDITVMFTDIRGFTTISEQLKPDELIHLMNDFLTPMSDLVMSNRGTIDKYMGDAMMAFWNAPLTDEEHARNACITALSMNEALKPINERIIAQAAEAGKEPLLLKAGIGVNSGPGAVGNMGSKQRFAYSVMGDTVNLASRLEGQTKGYGVDVLIGETTAAAVPDFALLELDLIRVKGKQVPVRIFTLLGNREEAQKSEFHILQLAHKKMLSLYRSREFSAALESLQDCTGHAPSSIHGYYEMMRERITEMQKTPPDESWDGVFVAQSK